MSSSDATRIKRQPDDDSRTPVYNNSPASSSSGPVLAPGDQLGDFQIEEYLGAGGMGEVFLARQMSLRRLVAIKVLPVYMTADSQTVCRFFHEVRLTARLEHPNLVTALHAGEDRDLHYLVLTYVAGETVHALIKRRRLLPEDQALQICREVAQALRYAWDRHQLIHRDIKPGNIMVTRAGEVKLLDFGLATAAGLAYPGDQRLVFGTPYFMSPEQTYAGQELDFRSDLYALGVTLYNMLVGDRPYRSTSSNDVMLMHRNAPVPDVRAANPSVSAATAALVSRLMAKSPADRPSSWQEAIAIMANLEAVAKARAQVVPTVVKHCVVAPAEMRLLLACAVLLFLLLLALLALYFSYHRLQNGYLR